MTDDKAHAAGFVVVGALYDGYHTTPDPLPPEEELWLAEHGLAYARFEPEKPGTGRILRGSYEPAGGGTPVWGTLVYER